MIIKGLLHSQQALNEERKTNSEKRIEVREGALQPFCNAPVIQGLQMPQGS